VNVLELQAEVTWAREAAAAAEAARVAAVLVVETSAQEATTARDSTATIVRDAEDQTAHVETEAQERVSRVEVQSAAALASAREDAKDLARKIALLEGELVEARQAREVVEENSRGLSDAMSDVIWEESEREHQEQFEEVTSFYRSGALSCVLSLSVLHG
jgi:hypothetical protein